MNEQLHVNKRGCTGQGCSSTLRKGVSPLATDWVGLTAFPSESHVRYFSANAIHLQSNLSADSVTLLHSSFSGSSAVNSCTHRAAPTAPSPPTSGGRAFRVALREQFRRGEQHLGAAGREGREAGGRERGRREAGRQQVAAAPRACQPPRGARGPACACQRAVRGAAGLTGLPWGGKGTGREGVSERSAAWDSPGQAAPLRGAL